MNKKISNWQNKNIWLIGASSGIGKALAINLIKAGANVYISSRKEKLLLEIKDQYPAQTTVLPLDVLDVEQIKNQFAKIQEIDLIIYLAADYSPLSVTNLDITEATKIVNVNLLGAINISSVVLPRLIKQQNGHLSFVASIAGYIGLPHSSIYGATKAALINMAESFYCECKEFNVDISIINPGFVETNLTSKNTFKMPYIMTPQIAADHIMKGFKKGRFDIVFPIGFSFFFRFIRILPYSLHLKLVKKLVQT
ncbi:MAG: SDR family NAD(P)-dependent oxidoreductase [Bacteriovorax sp.]|nr:SDR family NAD(P)-dependent oxidoreductase [Bacteriovorax sp.]